MRILLTTVMVMGLAAGAAADPIAATLEGCVDVTDPRLAEASWFAYGTYQAVAFDDDAPGCEATIARQVHDTYTFVDEGEGDLRSLLARLTGENLPTCGRRQYDVHFYLAGGLLDPFGLKSLVIDTGIWCTGAVVDLSTEPRDPGGPVREPPLGVLVLVTIGASLFMLRRRC